MRRLLTLTLASAAMLGLATSTITAAIPGVPGVPGVPGNRDGTETKNGTVKLVDPAAHQVMVTTAPELGFSVIVGVGMVTKDLTFTVTAETKITEQDAPKTLADLKPGTSVTVVYVRKGPVRTAESISILPTATPTADGSEGS